MAFYLSHEDDEADEMMRTAMRSTALDEDDLRKGSGAAVWCFWSIGVFAAACLVVVGHPVISGVVMVIDSVLLGLAFAPRRWWLL